MPSSRALVELLLLGPSHDKRQLQDSPVLGDVWIAYAETPASPVDLLITPFKGQSAGVVASRIATNLDLVRPKEQPRDEDALVAALQGLVAAKLFFGEMLRVVVPMTGWWKDATRQPQLQGYDPEPLRDEIGWVIQWAQTTSPDHRASIATELGSLSSLDRFVLIAALIWWAGKRLPPDTSSRVSSLMTALEATDAAVESVIGAIQEIRDTLDEDKFETREQVWQVSLNRTAVPAVTESIPAVKADAARSLFDVRCDKITWAVIDSGIDGTHPVFFDRAGKSRIAKALDFSNIRQIVSLDNLNTGSDRFKKRLEQLRKGREGTLPKDEATEYLRQLASDAADDRTINWGLVDRFIEIAPKTQPSLGHGTHVAGIIGANREGKPPVPETKSNDAVAGEIRRDDASGQSDSNPVVTAAVGTPDGAAGQAKSEETDSRFANGMCPDIEFYDLRVLGKTLVDTEFAIIAALQYVRYQNERRNHMIIHGVNLSLSIPHDIRNYACGRTPICDECERLVESGVVVVAAAGNLGYQQFETAEGFYSGYTAFSITDPGNADGVITVGATHRNKPHTYGVSFFSSRGPTGDGRLKPDLVAPGEKIESSVLNEGWGQSDGTSMAAPHVSGAAAMLMARYSELIGRPRRIKQILCESATDLGRERTFQGHGMLDVLRAFQRI